MSPDLGSVAQTLFSGWIGEGPKVSDFQMVLSDYLKNKSIARVLAVNSCTSAMELALINDSCGWRRGYY